MLYDRSLVAAALPGYEIGDELGRGGWGVVLAATHRQLGRNVAVKQLPRAFAADPSVRQRFLEEARTVAKLDHPHIVPIYDFVDHDGLCLIVMERMQPGTLWDRFVAQGIQLPQAVGVMLVASAGLEHAHRHGVIHRDIKPENFLYAQSGVLKLSDFGIAKVLDQASTALTVAGQVVGTPAYMAPEQALGGDLTPGVDIYACGVMLYELLTGQLPFPDSEEPLAQLTAKLRNPPVPIESLRPDLPPPVGEAIMRAIAREPSDRYASAHDFGMTLASATTAALGPGWLRSSAVEVHGAAEIVATTERTQRNATRVTPNATHVVRASTVHLRMGTGLNDVVAEPEPAPVPAPVPDPASTAAPAPGSRAEELIRMMEAGQVAETDGTIRVDFLPPAPEVPAAPPPAAPPAPAPPPAMAPTALVAPPPNPAPAPPPMAAPGPPPMPPLPGPPAMSPPSAPAPPGPPAMSPPPAPAPPPGPPAMAPMPPPGPPPAPMAPPPAPPPAPAPMPPPGPGQVPVAPPVPEYQRLAPGQIAPAAPKAKASGINLALIVASVALLGVIVVLVLLLRG